MLCPPLPAHWFGSLARASLRSPSTPSQPNGAACIDSWVGSGGWDVITINFGIHDCCPGGDGRPAGQNVPLPEYLKNLGAIYETASKALAPGGSIVWVTTTPHAVMDGYTDCGLAGGAFNSCIDDYNAAALTLMEQKPNVVVADLNAAVNQVRCHRTDRKSTATAQNPRESKRDLTVLLGCWRGRCSAAAFISGDGSGCGGGAQNVPRQLTVTTLTPPGFPAVSF